MFQISAHAKYTYFMEGFNILSFKKIDVIYKHKLKNRPPGIRSTLNSMTQQKTSFSLITGLMHLSAAVFCGTGKKT